MAIAKQAGFTEQTFNACLTDQKVLDGIQAARSAPPRSSASTPRRRSSSTARSVRGAVTIEELAKEIDPYLKSMTRGYPLISGREAAAAT